MTSMIKQTMAQIEATTPINKLAKDQLEQRLFTRELARTWTRVLVTFAVAFAVLALIIVRPLQQQKTFSIQQVLAATAAGLSNVPSGQVMIIRRTITSPQLTNNVPLSDEVMTDGTHFLETQMVHTETGPGEPILKTQEFWVEKNDDNRTITEYDWLDGLTTIGRDLYGDISFMTENIANSRGIGMWAPTPDLDLLGLASGNNTDATATALCDDHDDSTCIQFDNGEVPSVFLDATASVTLKIEQIDGDTYYHITAIGGRSLTGPRNIASVTRELWVQANTMLIMKRTWNGVMQDGTLASGEYDYDYQTVSRSDLGHPFTLEWWLSSVDPNAKAEIICSVYGLPCDSADKQTAQHGQFYLPDGWLSDPRLGNRNQISLPDESTSDPQG